MATAKRAGPGRLTADTWTGVALEAIAEGGLAAVSVEGLARRLGATKGSFYWHFDNRDALIEATLAAWEAGETVEVAKMLAPLTDAASRLRVLLRAALDDRPGARVEAGLLADSNVPIVRASLERATRARTDYLRQLFERIGVENPTGSGHHRVRHLPGAAAHAPSRRFQHPARAGAGPLRRPGLRPAHPRRRRAQHGGAIAPAGRLRPDAEANGDGSCPILRSWVLLGVPRGRDWPL